MTHFAAGHVVSVVIPMVNRRSLERTLEALKVQTRPARPTRSLSSRTRTVAAPPGGATRGTAGYFLYQFRRGRGIACLDAAYGDEKVLGAGPPGILWGNHSLPGVRWLKVFWKKAVGPFDAANFHTLSAFVVFWIGEKFEGAGFLRGLFDRRRIKREINRRKTVLREGTPR